MDGKHNNYGYNKNLKDYARKLRNNSTEAEIRLWTELLRARKMRGYQFLRQRPVHNYIADFMCKELMMIIEVDGITHDIEEQWKKDKVRQKELENFGFTVLRFSDEEVMTDIDNVERVILGWIEENPPVP
ncbi:MAG: DUF559 domain-containing protein [Candidatus Marinimicrobia bacterium]|nr:DUF559 domain-containing protein [Candidatus Neomarinimicrobiota bacterium]MCF7828293.1 DUF559 domain-containing protein [Candidatus Neomarinimicrobiota bacterium]MCF7879532.1 DUF559 domain-containing protein [Candidatus Neomarinimicrobiota bacterium]